MSKLELNNRQNVNRLDGATAITSGYNSSHVIGRLNSKYRLERYSLKTSEPISNISFDLKNKENLNFFNYDLGGQGLYGTVKVFLSEKEDMSDWANFSPIEDHNRTAKLEFVVENGIRTSLQGNLDLSKEPLQKDKTYYLFFYTENTSSTWGGIYWTNNSSYSDENPINNSTYSSYGQCGAPTEFNFDGDILSSGFTVRWEGATPGINNDLKGYTLTLQVDEVVTEVELESTASSYTIESETHEFNGKEITLTIQAIGEHGELYDSEVKQISGRANCRPVLEVTPSYKEDGVYVSAGEAMTVEFQLSAQDNDDDEIKYFYSTGTHETKTEIRENPLALSISKTTSLIIYAFDGKEYDRYETTIKVYSLDWNVAKVIETSYSRGGEKCVTELSYKFSQQDKVRAKINFLEKEQIVETKNGLLNLDFVSICGLPKERTDYEVTFVPIADNGAEIQGAKMPTYSGVLFPIPSTEDCSVFDDENEKISDSNLFGDLLKIKIPVFNPRTIEYDIDIFLGEEKQILIQKDYRIVHDKNKRTDYYIIQAVFGDTKAIDSPKELRVDLFDSKNSYQFYFGEYSQVAPFEFENLVLNTNDSVCIYDMYANETPIQLSMGWLQERYQKSGIDTEEADWIVCTISNLTDDILNIGWGITAEKGTGKPPYPDPSTMYLSLSHFTTEKVKELLGGDDTKCVGKKRIKISLIVKNVYGKQSQIDREIIIDFDKKMQFKKHGEYPWFSLHYENSSDPIINLASSNDKYYNFGIIEGMQIRASFQATYWGNREYSLCLAFNDQVFYTTKLARFNALGEYWLNSKETSKRVGGIIFSPSSSNEEENKLTLYAISETGEVISDIISETISLPIFSLSQTTYTLTRVGHDNGKLSATIARSNSQFKDLDVTTQINGNLNINNSELAFDGNLDKDTLSFEIEDSGIEIDGVALAQCSLKEKNTLKFRYNGEEYSYSIERDDIQTNKISLYSSTPTVSYRKNRVGINTNNMDNNEGIIKDSVFYVARSSEARYVTFKIYDGENNIDRELTIDLFCGAINNAILNGGSWDGAPNENIPSYPGEAPSGLAAIAYSGDIADLEQKTGEVITFFGGSAPIQKI